MVYYETHGRMTRNGRRPGHGCPAGIQIGKEIGLHMNHQLFCRTARFRHAAGALLAAVLLAVLPVIAQGDGAEISVMEDITGKAEVVLAEVAVLKLNLRLDDGREITVRRDGRINGRGKSDDREGSEPYYWGMVGYAVVANDETLITEQLAAELPWTIATWEQGDSGWEQTGSIVHKTAVLVIGQELEKVKDGMYGGYLHVLTLDRNRTCWIDVRCFATAPYWLYNPERSVKYGASMAVYKPASGSLPLEPEGSGTARPEQGTSVLIPGKNAWNPELPDKSHTVPGITVGSGDGEEEAEKLVFNEADLSLIY